jgi:hypothetical protein
VITMERLRIAASCSGFEPRVASTERHAAS